MEYQKADNDVRIIALIRDPKDVIASQYAHWNNLVSNDSPEFRERQWLIDYLNLKDLREIYDVPMFRYEDVANYPETNFDRIYKHLGIDYDELTFSHIRPVNTGRFYKTKDEKLQRWKFTSEFQRRLEVLGYSQEDYNQHHARNKTTSQTWVAVKGFLKRFE